jgi:4-hydroxy-tetrahydrodipicolinate synthase
MASIGGGGVVSVISNIVPRRLVEMCNAAADGRSADAIAIHRELFMLCRAMFAETNPIPLKAALRLLSRDTGALRLPMCEASAETRTAVRKALATAGLV